MTVAGTGHRPHKLNNEYINKFTRDMYSQYGILSKAIFNEVQAFLSAYKVDKVISGLAIGFDQILAHAALQMDIPYTAAIPFRGQESRWPFATREWYNYLVSNANEIVIVSGGEYSPTLMQKRNEWMVDRVKEENGKLLALWDGSEGGTKNCIDYASRVLMPEDMHRIDPRELWKMIKELKP